MRPPPRTLHLALVTLALFLALFPFGWLGRRWPDFRAWLDRAFLEPRDQILGHAAAFGFGGTALLAALPALADLIPDLAGAGLARGVARAHIARRQAAR